MKHFLNFKPTIVFRKGSSFMLKTSLLILYAVPLALAVFLASKYFAAVETTRFYQEAEAALIARTGEFNEQLNRDRPAREDIEAEEKNYQAYRHASLLGHTSWSNLLNRLEKLTPAQVRFRKIGIRPDTLVRISLEGETSDLSHATALLRSLFAESVFVNPILKKHARAKLGDSEGIVFTLDVDYAGESGELP